MQLKWAAGGGGLLAETSSDSDSSNRSYYGETKLHFLSVRCCSSLLACGVQVCVPDPGAAPANCAHMAKLWCQLGRPWQCYNECMYAHCTWQQ